MVDDCFTVAGQVRPECCGNPLDRDGLIDVFLQATGRWKKGRRGSCGCAANGAGAGQKLEAGVGIEPTHGALAAPGLPTWLPRQASRSV